MKTEEGALTLNAAVQRNQAPVKTTTSLNYHFTYRPEAAFLMKNSFNTHTKKEQVPVYFWIRQESLCR